MTTEAEVVCATCGRPENDHPFKHPFTKPGENQQLPEPVNKKKKEEPTARLSIMPAPDLVLRGVLLRKSLITTEELEAVERELAVGFSPPPGKANVLSTEPPANS